ncbi:MAG: pirin family protein [Deltaproteobacteria bacterium]|nr:pirin family protein [Deltaproteobacteria bacterium]
MTTRNVVAATALAASRMAAGFRTRSLRHGSTIPLDPFLNVDEFHMSTPTFPPHPHAGFSAVTYMFEASDGGFINRDSLGDRSRIEPGAIHWTQAARGMLHEEIPEHPGIDCHGLQMFVNLRRADKQAAPRAFHVAREHVPEWRADGARVRVLAGRCGDVESPLVDLLTDALLLDVQLDPGARVSLPVRPDHNIFAMAIAGEGFADERGATLSAEPGSDRHAVGYDHGGNTVTFTTQGRALHLVIGGGTPIREPVVFGGPFAMTSAADVAEAFARYERGDMGQLDASFTAR